MILYIVCEKERFLGTSTLFLSGLGALTLVFIYCINIFCIASDLIDVTMEACFILNDRDGCETYTPKEFSRRLVLLRISRIVVVH